MVRKVPIRIPKYPRSNVLLSRHHQLSIDYVYLCKFIFLWRRECDLSRNLFYINSCTFVHFLHFQISHKRKKFRALLLNLFNRLLRQEYSARMEKWCENQRIRETCRVSRRRKAKIDKEMNAKRFRN